MSYQLAYTKRALKDIQNLSIDTKQRLKLALDKYVENPLFYAKKLVNSDIGNYRFRVGEYRIIFDIIEDNQLLILRVGHRKDIYRTL